MTDDVRTSLVPYRNAPPPAQTPTPSLPSLPNSSGALLGTRNAILKKDTAFVELHTAYLNARRRQSDEMNGLVESRMKAALTMAKLTALPEIALHEYERGRRDRTHELTMLDLLHQTDEAIAAARLAEAQKRLADVMPKPPEAPQTPPTATGLSPADVEKVAQNMPELKPDTIQSLVWALGGLLAEKTK